MRLKKNVFIIIFLFFGIFSYSQDYLKIATNYLNKGMVSRADSILRTIISVDNFYENAHFNYGYTRLLLKDTCTFCNEMFDLWNLYNDIEAKNLYLKICGGKIDTFNLNWRKKIIFNRKRTRITKIVVKNKFQDYYTVYIKDRWKKGKYIMYKEKGMIGTCTDIIGVYRIYNDTSYIYTYSNDAPKLIKGKKYDIYNQKIKDYYSEVNKKVNDNVIFYISYIITKNGDICDLNFIGGNQTPDKLDEYKEYVRKIIYSKPKYKPAIFWGKEVDYLIFDEIAFRSNFRINDIDVFLNRYRSK